uniref:Si:ch211-120k19.1 n=1 Tax=Gasterosteus aculeatus aculeatus TaxID=481459 RepID=G3PCK8_GASAC
MNRAWAAIKAHPYISNTLGYTTLFASADLIQQHVLGGKPAAGSASEDSGAIDWGQTARVATVGFCFHANFNYHWLRGLERMLPGGGVKAVTGKVMVDQLVAAPLTISAFYIGEQACVAKAVNFALVPPVARTVFLGGIALTFTIFLCHLREQSGHKPE